MTAEQPGTQGFSLALKGKSPGSEVNGRVFSPTLNYTVQYLPLDRRQCRINRIELPIFLCLSSQIYLKKAHENIISKYFESLTLTECDYNPHRAKFNIEPEIYYQCPMHPNIEP